MEEKKVTELRPDRSDVYGHSPQDQKIGYHDGDRWQLCYRSFKQWLLPTATRVEANHVLDLVEQAYQAGARDARREMREALGIRGD